MLTKEECLKSLCRIQCGARRDKKCEDCECFWPEQDPNILQEKHEDLITKLVNGQVPYKSKKVKKS